jgi:hypothetical protein
MIKFLPDVLHDAQIVKFLEFCDRSPSQPEGVGPKRARVYSAITYGKP